jgi:hypothetical protein
MHLAAQPLLLPYPRMYVRQLFMRFRRVKLESLEAQLRPVEQLDKRPHRQAEGRTMQEQLSRSRDWVLIIREV